MFICQKIKTKNMRHPQTYEIMNELRDRLIETYSDHPLWQKR
jgi:hypothetical protein